jgi:hypothetical protein
MATGTDSRASSRAAPATWRYRPAMVTTATVAPPGDASQ